MEVKVLSDIDEASPLALTVWEERIFGNEVCLGALSFTIERLLSEFSAILLARDGEAMGDEGFVEYDGPLAFLRFLFFRFRFLFGELPDPV